MDPQKLSSLDPKLRDAYQRVMGTVIPEPQAPPAPAQTSTPIPDPTSAPQPEPKPESTPTPTQPPASEPQPIPTPTPTMPESPASEPQPAIFPQPEPKPESAAPAPSAQTNNFVQMNSEVPSTPIAGSPNFTAPAAFDAAPAPQAQIMAVKKKNGILPILFGIVGLIFLVIYTLFWTKIFNFKLPFLP